MDNKHILNLSKLCRLCGSKIQTTRGYPSAKLVFDFKKEFQQINIDIDKDVYNVHPTKLCNKCYLKLYRWRKEKGEDTSNRSSLVFEFKEHSDTECIVCERKSGRPAKSVKIVESSETFDIEEAAKKFGFYSFFDSSLPRNKYFGMLKNMNGSLVNVKTITVLPNGHWTLSLFNKKLDFLPKPVSNLPNVINSNTSALIFFAISNHALCEGNSDYPDIVNFKIDKAKPEHFKSVQNEDIAFIQNFNLESWNDFSTIRHRDCFLLVKDKLRCDVCSKYRANLNVLRGRIQKESNKSQFTNDRYLSKDELLQKLKDLELEKKKSYQKISRLTHAIRNNIKEHGICADEETYNIVKEAMEKEMCPFAKDSPQFLLWEQQKLQSSLKNSKAMSWHPLIIRWCLSIYLKSPSTYKHLRTSPFLFLPCKNTLLNYINFTDPGCGFNIDVISRLVQQVKFDEINEFEKNVSLIFDEMKIKSGLVFSKTTGNLVGFCEMGEINDEIEKFSKAMESQAATEKQSLEPGSDRNIAKYVIVFMVRGIFSNLQYAFGHFAGEGFDSDQIFPCALEAIRILESIGLCVRAITADGASPNRKYFNLHKLENQENVKDGVVYWTYNPWAPLRKIYFICDVPHLIKTTRNNIENSHGNLNTRNLMYQEQPIGWHHILALYEWDLGVGRAAFGLKMGHKLREEHIKLNPRSRMRVNLAAQVLSRTVADMLSEQNLPHTKSTEKLIRMMDRFFDCLNVTRYTNHSKKPELEPYRYVDDWRFDWLESEFLGFLAEWQNESQGMEYLSKSEKSRLCLSRQTIDGLRITVNSFIALGRLLLNEDGVKFLLSEKLSQDPLEEYFSKQRAKGGADENPTLETFNRNFLGLNVAGDELVRVVNGNTRGRQREIVQLDVHDIRRLPTKKDSLIKK